MFSMMPPRHEFVLIRTTRSSSGESITQSCANTFWQPPLISEPITTPPCPFFISQLRMMMFLAGMLRSRPSRLRPLLMAMQSSPVLKKQSSISTRSQHSGSQPSPLGPSLIIFTRRTVMSVECRGWMTQNGERSRVMSSIRMRSHLLKFTNCGRRPSFGPKTRSGVRSPFSLYMGMPSSPFFSSRGRASFFCAIIPSFHP